MLTRQEGGKGLAGTHKSDMKELEEQEDLEMILQRMTKRMTSKIQKKSGKGAFINLIKALIWKTAN